MMRNFKWFDLVLVAVAAFFIGRASVAHAQSGVAGFVAYSTNTISCGTTTSTVSLPSPLGDTLWVTNIGTTEAFFFIGPSATVTATIPTGGTGVQGTPIEGGQSLALAINTTQQSQALACIVSSTAVSLRLTSGHNHP
jgi:hypothetical protein